MPLLFLVPKFPAHQTTQLRPLLGPLRYSSSPDPSHNTDPAAREPGLLLSCQLYSPTYAAGAAYMRGTYREYRTVFTGAMAFWLVRTFPSRPARRVAAAALRAAHDCSASSRTSSRT
jgi:hypothetical protein